VEILSNFQNVKTHIEDLLVTVLVQTSHPFAGRVRCIRFLALWKSSKHANRERSSCNHLGAFCSCVRDFYSRGQWRNKRLDSGAETSLGGPVFIVGSPVTNT